MESNQNSTLMIALNKGRPLASLLGVLESVGIKPTVSPETSRKLVLPTSMPEISLLVLRDLTSQPTWSMALPTLACSAKIRC